MKHWLSAGLALAVLGGTPALAQTDDAKTDGATTETAATGDFSQVDPIIFVHGDSDTAALWTAQMWRFESNGFPRDKMFAIDLDNPGARDDDTVPQDNRSSTEEVATQLKEKVESVLQRTGAQKVDLVGNSRGCQTIRNYLQNYGGAEKTDAAVLTGCVYKGVYVNPGDRLGSEYNGAGPFLTGLAEGYDTMKNVDVTTIRSDRFDLYNQPMGDYIGAPGVPIGGTHEGPELEGADNQVIPGADHRETAYSPEAFEIMFEAITGQEPATNEIRAEQSVTLNGEVSGWANDRPDNLPLPGAQVSVYETDPQTGDRKGEPVHQSTVGDDGMWGPFDARPDQTYEFVIEAEGYPTHHIYRSPFPRSSDIVNLRLYPKEGAATESKSHIMAMRPRGYLGIDDEVQWNGQKAEGLGDKDVPNVWKVAEGSDEAGETKRFTFEGETIAGKTWPSDTDTAWIELTN